MRRLAHVERLVVRLARAVLVHAMEDDVARLRARRTVGEDVAEPRTGPLPDDAPALDAVMSRHLREAREPAAQRIEVVRFRRVDEPGDEEPVAVPRLAAPCDIIRR